MNKGALIISLPWWVPRGRDAWWWITGLPKHLSPYWPFSHVGTLWIRHIPQSTRIIVPSRTSRTCSQGSLPLPIHIRSCPSQLLSFGLSYYHNWIPDSASIAHHLNFQLKILITTVESTTKFQIRPYLLVNYDLSISIFPIPSIHYNGSYIFSRKLYWNIHRQMVLCSSPYPLPKISSRSNYLG